MRTWRTTKKVIMLRYPIEHTFGVKEYSLCMARFVSKAQYLVTLGNVECIVHSIIAAAAKLLENLPLNSGLYFAMGSIIARRYKTRSLACI